MTRLRRDDGFQLVELMVVMVLLTLLGGATTSVVLSSLRAERVTDDLRTNLDEARVAVERMRRDVREARRIYDTNPHGLVTGPAQLSMWRDVNQDQLQQQPELVTYRFRATADGTGVLERRTAEMPAGQWRAIARHLDLSAEPDGRPRSRFETTPAPPQTASVTMVVTVVARPESGADARNMSITETVRLRNAN
jgi:Tfp pilus assembly protein PilW